MSFYGGKSKQNPGVGFWLIGVNFCAGVKILDAKENPNLTGDGQTDDSSEMGILAGHFSRIKHVAKHEFSKSSEKNQFIFLENPFTKRAGHRTANSLPGPLIKLKTAQNKRLFVS